MFFSDIGGKAEKGTPYYIHTRVRRARARAYAQGKGWRKRGLKDWKGRRQEEGEIVAREENTKKKGRDRSLLKFYTLGKRKNYAIRNNWINILRGTF